MVIGGFTKKFSDLETEVWNTEDGSIKTINPTLPDGDYRYGIALFAVDIGFCSQ